VNKTETEYTLAMITKAGIPSIKVVPGLALYGRSFEMTDPSCQGPECTFTGKESGATKGACTDTYVFIIVSSYFNRLTLTYSFRQCRLPLQHRNLGPNFPG
jgi:GH18 family chitinase